MFKNSFGRRFTVICLVLLLLPLLTGCGDGKNQAKAPKIVPNFTLTALDGTQITRDSLKGKVVLLDFWATWCPPCRAAIPHLVSTYETYKDKGFEVVGVCLDQGGDVAKISDFIKRNQVSYPIAIGADNPITRDLGNITSLPTMILLDRNSSIEFKVVGFNSEIGKKLESKIKEILAKHK